MACDYYCFRQNDYYCMKKQDYINEDTYFKYCRNYDYSDCPVYKCEENSGGCFITTACVYSLGCQDNCNLLNTLRNFRDTYLKSRNGGQEDIDEYYAYAPSIVEAINKDENKASIYKEIFEKSIHPCFNLINSKKYEEAYKMYKSMYTNLKEKFLNK